MSENLKRYTTVGGREIDIDVSDDAIKSVRKRYCDTPLKHKDTVKHPLFSKKANVVGVAYSGAQRKNVLYFAFDGDDGRVSTFHTPKKVLKI